MTNDAASTHASTHAPVPTVGTHAPHTTPTQPQVRAHTHAPTAPTTQSTHDRPLSYGEGERCRLAEEERQDWKRRLADAVEKTLRDRAAHAATRAEHAERRRRGLAARHRQKLTRTRRNTVDTEIRADISHLDPDQCGALARLLGTAARATSDTHVTKTLADLANQAAARRTPDATHGR
jgi:hypothetical protein